MSGRIFEGVTGLQIRQTKYYLTSSQGMLNPANIYSKLVTETIEMEPSANRLR